jgi:hypothetical protein
MSVIEKTPNTARILSTPGYTTWKNAQEALNFDTIPAFTTNTTTSSRISRPLTLINFGFNIPIDATILSVMAYIYRDCVNIPGVYVYDEKISLVHNDVAIGENKKKEDAWIYDTSTAQTYGAVKDLWQATLTPEIVNSESFGIWIQVNITNNGQMANVYWARIAIEFSSTHIMRPGKYW